ncbi:MAG: Glu/Leu/Phe/Val dehydrogenase dimerization domain-containing protein [Longimicrobiales bacterium]
MSGALASPMTGEMFELMAEWDGIGVVVRHDAPTGTWIFIALHDDTLGQPVGGCRMKVYERPEDALVDALRLAKGMTSKWAAIDFPFGGGKSVLAIPHELEGAERTGLLQRFGELLNTLKGTYGTGEDMGTTPEDILTIAQVTSNVMGVESGSTDIIDPGPYTALGVFESIRSVLRHTVGSDDMTGKRILIQGIGRVGEPLARTISAAGGQVLLSDVDTSRVAALAEELGGTVVPAEAIYSTDCDVFAPCAIGAILSEDTIPLLKCRGVAGSANNQLRDDGDAELLHGRGILYAPDYIANGGGAMAFGLIFQGVTGDETLRSRVSTIGASLDEIFEESASESISPLVSASRRVERILMAARRPTA